MGLRPTASRISTVTILLVTQGRVRDLERCLESVRREMTTVPFGFEILAVINGVCRGSLELLTRYDEVRVLQCSRRTPAAARNLALDEARGDFVFFLDDDADLPPGYFSRAAATLARHPEADVLGGPDATAPTAGLVERAIGLTLQSPLATGPTRRRHGAIAGNRPFRCNDDALILCNLWVRRELLATGAHRFFEEFWRNEENVLLFQLRDHVAFCDPLLAVHHRRKTDLKIFTRANLYSGFFRARSFRAEPSSLRLDFFAPTAFLAVLAGSLVVRSPSLIAAVVGYAVLNVFFAARAAWSGRDARLIPLVAFYQLVVTAAYGTGFAWGLIARRALVAPAPAVRESGELQEALQRGDVFARVGGESNV